MREAVVPRFTKVLQPANDFECERRVFVSKSMCERE